MQRTVIWALIAVVVILLVFFIGGGYAAYTQQFDQERYIFIATVIGGVVGVLGLFGLISVLRKPFSVKDLGQEQAEMLEKLLVTTKEANEYEAKALATKEDIDRLNAERAKIEMLVRQATLKILLEEKLKVVAEEIEERIDGDRRLSELLASYQVLRKQVEAVNGELRESGRASEVEKIMIEVNQLGWQGAAKKGAIPSVGFINAVVIEAFREKMYSDPVLGSFFRAMDKLAGPPRRRRKLKPDVTV